MLRIVGVLAIVASLAFTACAPKLADKPSSSPADFVGTWKGTWNGTQGNTRSGGLIIVLEKAGAGLKGTIAATGTLSFAPDYQPLPIKTLTVSGNDIAITVTGVDGNVRSATLTLQKSGKEMTGWNKSDGYGYFRWDVTRQ